MKPSSLKIEEVKIETLNPNEYNPRQATEKQIRDLTESIKEFGLSEPLIVNRNPGRLNVLIGGHLRLQICKALGSRLFLFTSRI